MTEEIDAVVFDAGGTLFDMNPPREETFAEVLGEDGFEIDVSELRSSMKRTEREMDREFAMIQGSDDRDFWLKYDKHVLTDIGYKGDFDSISCKISEAFGRRVPDLDSWKNFPETVDVLEALRHRTLKLGVISNASDLVNRVLDHLDLSKYFDFIVVSQIVGISKPSPGIFRIASQEAGMAPNRILYVGDRPATDIEGAVRAGLNAILVDRYDSYPDVDCFRIRDLSWFMTFL